MHGTLTGFKPHHRLESAKELASYLTAVVGTKMEPHTPTPSFPRPGGNPSPVAVSDRTMLQPKTQRAHFSSLGVPVATGMGGSREIGARPVPDTEREGDSPVPRSPTKMPAPYLIRAGSMP